MKQTSEVGLAAVQAVYSGPEGDLWELLMGEQIHIGGFLSSMDLAERAGIRPGMTGVDLCCASGAGMRFLLRFRQVGHMTGVDATRAMLERARIRAADEGLTGRLTFVEADAPATGLPSESVDFIWGEDAWCYVVDKPGLVAEAIRIVRPSGLIAFTDWMEGPVSMTEEEAGRYLHFMKFPSVLSLQEYEDILVARGAEVLLAEDTGRFSRYVPLYLEMIEQQLTYDALKIIGFDAGLAGELTEGMRFLGQLADERKIIQGLVVARKTGTTFN